MLFEFGELKNDTNFVAKIESVSFAITQIEESIKNAANVKIEELSPEEKVKYDSFLIYAVNSLYFAYLKIEGENTSTVSS